MPVTFAGADNFLANWGAREHIVDGDDALVLLTGTEETAPTPFFADLSTTNFCGDFLQNLKHIPENSVDAVVTDPPYGLAALPVGKVSAALSEWLSGDRSYIPKG